MEYLGQCPKCKGWNTYKEVSQEELQAKAEAVRKPGQNDESRAVPITEVEITSHQRMSTDMSEFDRVLGGETPVTGIVLPSLQLLAGDPGIGKSTLLVKCGGNIARSKGNVIYVTGEEDKSAVTARAMRVDAMHPNLHLMATYHIEYVEAEVARLEPWLLIVDSTQTMKMPDIDSDLGSERQVKGLAHFLRRLVNDKERAHAMSALLVGHVTKDGQAAGPKTLEHLVDATLYFEGDKERSLRTLRADKNRFNSTSDIGMMEMTQAGLQDITSPSNHLLAQRLAGAAGSVVIAACSGGMNSRRSVLVEVQVLIGNKELPRRQLNVTGLSIPRVALMCGVLARKTEVELEPCELFAGTVGGLAIEERAADLGVAVAIASAVEERPVHDDVVVFGEVGMMGEVRDVPQVIPRLKEAASLGFRRAIVPPLKELEPIDGIELVRVSTLSQAIEAALV